MPRKAPLNDGKVEDSEGERYRILLACWLGCFFLKLMHSYHWVAWCLAPHPIPTGCSALTLFISFYLLCILLCSLRLANFQVAQEIVLDVTIFVVHLPGPEPSAQPFLYELPMELDSPSTYSKSNVSSPTLPIFEVATHSPSAVIGTQSLTPGPKSSLPT